MLRISRSKTLKKRLTKFNLNMHYWYADMARPMWISVYFSISVCTQARIYSCSNMLTNTKKYLSTNSKYLFKFIMDFNVWGLLVLPQMHSLKIRFLLSWFTSLWPVRAWEPWLPCPARPWWVRRRRGRRGGSESDPTDQGGGHRWTSRSPKDQG